MHIRRARMTESLSSQLIPAQEFLEPGVVIFLHRLVEPLHSLYRLLALIMSEQSTRKAQEENCQRLVSEI
ncbi:hypothetical protein M378DRAFT_156006 [Amanita muscaria Koide BX008]|uniref:Uncharacterized protein n=1 Tax=Amanita muscaria (strain Koide BX008) TaxID=946122 RepID=A0A0C2XPG5_AMAMK|nr:hypothetical protein M378DRAFT_156006 [Amanita muscaria Koide BX008]